MTPGVPVKKVLGIFIWGVKGEFLYFVNLNKFYIMWRINFTDFVLSH